MAAKDTTSRDWRERVVRLSMGLCIGCAFLALYLWQPLIVQQADRNIYDIFLRANGGGTPSPTPALIDIDDASLASIGQWPWPRHIVGKLVANLTEAGAAAIGLDIIFSEPDNTSLKSLQESFEQHFNMHLPLTSIPAELYDNDRIFATILQQSPVVLGSFTQFKGHITPLPPDNLPADGIWINAPKGSLEATRFIPKGLGATLPLPELRAVAPLATLNAESDPDGITRSIPLLTQVGDRIFISLAVRSLMRALGESTLGLSTSPEGLKALHVKKYTIPVQVDGSFMVPYRGGRKYYPTFSAADILHNKIPPEEIQGRIFIVGTSAPGLLDIRPTPFDAIYSGAEIHAAVLDAILSQRFIQIPSAHEKIQKVAIIALGICGAAFFAIVPPLGYFPVFIALIGTILWGTWDAFRDGVYLSPLYAMLTIFTQAGMLLVIRFWQEAQQKRTLRNAFSRYIAPDMVKRIVERGEVVLAGEERTVTLLFSDIRNFTSLSEKLTPNQVVSALNRYFTPMTAIIHHSQGTVDKFIGDSVMAFWNAPLNVPRHPLLAINSALHMHDALHKLNQTLHEEMQITFNMGIGIHTGKVFVGNMGSAELLDYTCIGDSVNLAARLEGLCPLYGAKILTSSTTAQLCQSYVEELKELQSPKEKNEHIPTEVPYFLPLDAIRVKGKMHPVEICMPIPLAEKALREEEIEQFIEARKYYLCGYFQKSFSAFTQLQKDFPHTTLYALYAHRSNTLQAAPPPNWDGVWTYTEK